MARKPSHVDLLIIGAGPAGLMAGLWAASCGIDTRVIDKRSHKLVAGHGDGLQARTVEIMDSFGLATSIIEAGCPHTQGVWWVLDKNWDIVRIKDKIANFDAPSRFGAIGLTQAKVADLMINRIEDTSAIRIERSKIAESVDVDRTAEYPVRVGVREVTSPMIEVVNNNLRIDDDADILRKSKQDNGTREDIHAKYVIACDGAHSWMRQQLEIPMEGDDIDIVWGVMDIVPLTNFPTPRVLNLFAGNSTGLLWIPRERGLVRIYCVLGNAESDEKGKLVRSSITSKSILEAVQKNLHPYKLDYAKLEWWAAYQIGQRVAADNIDSSGHIFLAGDAVHTHSPQAGQGLNVSVADTHNLVWKINLVLKGLAGSETLATYRDERLEEAKRLVNFDRTWAAVASGREPPPQPDGTIVKAQEVWDKAPKTLWLMAHGLQVAYSKGLLIARDPPSDLNYSLSEGILPSGIISGMRMPSFYARRHSDGHIQHLGRSFQSDGAFRFVVFAGDVSQQAKMDLCKQIGDQILSLMRTYTYENQSASNAVFDTILLHADSSRNLSIQEFHEVYVPVDPVTQGHNYDKVFFDENDIVTNEHVHLGSAYEQYHVDPELGRLVLLRRDGHVAYQGNLDAFNEVKRYFEGFLTKKSSNSQGGR